MIIGLPDVAVGSVVAALIAGIVSLLGLIVSKEQKVSEFRQDWIDSFREELASLISHANAIHGSSTINWKNDQDRWRDVRADFVGINDSVGRIRLRLNPKEATSIKILGTIEEIENLLNDNINFTDASKLNKIEKRLAAESNDLLKSEWKRVKTGEIGYRVAKWAALSVVVACIVGGLVIGIQGEKLAKAPEQDHGSPAPAASSP